MDAIKLMAAMTTLSHKQGQVVGEMSSYYVTLAQLESAMMNDLLPASAEPQVDAHADNEYTDRLYGQLPDYLSDRCSPRNFRLAHSFLDSFPVEEITGPIIAELAIAFEAAEQRATQAALEAAAKWFAEFTGVADGKEEPEMTVADIHYVIGKLPTLSAPTVTPPSEPSRSVQRREALQKGEEMPTFARQQPNVLLSSIEIQTLLHERFGVSSVTGLADIAWFTDQLNKLIAVHQREAPQPDRLAAPPTRLIQAAEKLLSLIWETNFDEEVETDYERAVVALRDALIAEAEKGKS